MEKIHRDRIQVNYLQLSKFIRSDIPRLVKYLSQENLLSDTMEEDILYQRTPSEQAYKLLDTIQTRGPRAFSIFYKAVCDGKLWGAANLLEPSKGSHFPPENASQGTPSSAHVASSVPAEVDDPLPDDWPSESHMNNVENLRLKVIKVDEHQTQMISLFHNPIKQEIYELDQENKGRVFIIENFNFHNGLTYRLGSEQDSKGLVRVFQEMKFEVIVERNKTKEEMEDILDDECRFNFTKYGCYILIMLSHGIRGKVFGTNGKPAQDGKPAENYLEIEKVKERVAALETLKGKPKMFIIQACQSDEARTSDTEQLVQESSAAINESANAQQHLSSIPSSGPGALVKLKSPRINPEGDQSMDYEVGGDSIDADSGLFEDSDMLDGKGNDTNSGSLATDAGEDGRSSLVPHQGADIFTALATVEGYPSYRNTAFGSWFIQALIYVLANYSHKHDLSSLMLKVTQLVTKARSRKAECQVCESRSTLNKKFFFFPGLERDSS